MTPEFNYKNEQTERTAGRQAINLIDVWQQRVRFERLWGFTPAQNGEHHPCYITRCYENVTVTSLQRLHNVVAKLVNKSQAKISLSQIAKYGISYEVEL